MIVLKQMLIFFIMIVIGIIARKNKMITPENQGNLSALVVRITSPCLILSSAMSAGERMPFSEIRDSYAIILVSKGAEGSAGFQWKSLLNPGMAACILTCFIYFLQISVPYVIVQSVSMIGSITAPLSMMMIGASLLDVDFKAMFTDIKLYLFIFLKMLVFPMVSMLAALYNKDSYLMTTQEIALSTLVSVITLPIVAMVI